MRSLLILLLASGALCAYGGEGAFPWEELKALYREAITRDLQEARPPEDAPGVVTLDEAQYRLRIGATHTEGEVALSGRVLEGAPSPIALFGPEVVLRGAAEVSGANLLTGNAGEGTLLLPAAQTEPFRVEATFLLRAMEDRGAQVLHIKLPPAVRNQVEITLEDGLRLLESPGIEDGAGVYHLPASGNLELRYALASADVQPQAPEIDIFTRIVVRQRDIVLESYGVPVRAIPPDTVMHLSEGARFASTTLRPSEFTQIEPGQYAIKVGSGAVAPFVVESALAIPEAGSLRLALPRIEGNTGREGRFVVIEPDDGRALVEGEGLVSHLPASHLGEGYPVGGAATYMRIPDGQLLSLNITRFKAEHVMDTVLESQSFHVAFDETGRSLSTLRLELPPEAGPRLKIEPVDGSEIWSLLVNDRPRQVYSDATGAWIVSLESGKPSTVELAFLREGEPLGLQGALSVDMPKTGLAARILHVGIDLPERVELRSVEGPVNTVGPGVDDLPEGMPGAAYVFTQPFYKGEGVHVAVSYKEPVNGKN